MFLLAMAAAVSAAIPRERANWITDNDYPKSAYAAGQQGRVTVALTVDDTGEPEVCAVQSTTADAALAKLSCTLLVQRAHFQPARDERGKPVESRFTQTVQWTLPDPRSLADTGYATRFDIREDGGIADCSVVGLGGQPLDRQTARMCDQFRDPATLAVFAKRPLEKIRSIELRFLIRRQNADETITVVPPHYDFHRVISTAEFLLDGGSASQCATTAMEAIGGTMFDACRMLGLAGTPKLTGLARSRPANTRAIFDAVGYYR
jgi:TonB family protein